MVHLSRLSEEVILWSSEEFSFVKLKDSCATGSSIMPQRKNPDVPECGAKPGSMRSSAGTADADEGVTLGIQQDLQEDKEALLMP